MPDNEEHSEPVMCSKCNILFSTEREYLRHYNEIHRMAESSSSWLHVLPYC